jgi:hypothetical protein
MGNVTILIPAMCLIGWTYLVMLLIPFRRFRAAAKKQVTAADFKYGESDRVPGEVTLANRNYMNLLEAPVLFYVLCIVDYATQTNLPALAYCAWLFVALRIAHTLIHVTYNNVNHRLYAFAASNLIALFMWFRLFVALVN